MQTPLLVLCVCLANYLANTFPHQITQHQTHPQHLQTNLLDLARYQLSNNFRKRLQVLGDLAAELGLTPGDHFPRGQNGAKGGM